MASSQVEIASSSPFGCVLKDHNSRRDRRRDSNANPNPKSQSNFQRNLKELVRDHLHSCISISPRGSNPEPDENSLGGGGNFSCFGCSNSSKSHRNNNNNNNNSHRWAAQKAKEMVSTIDSLSSSSSKPQPKPQPSPTPQPAAQSSDGSDISVSSLVQKWRGFEAEAKHIQPHNSTTTNVNNNNVIVNTSAEVVSRACSVVSSTCESIVTTTAEDEGAAEERDRGPEDDQGGEREREKERIRVADIVRRWRACDEGPAGNPELPPTPVSACLARLRMETGAANSNVVVCSPRIIRGRQAVADLFMRIERERYKEIELLQSRQAVSKFPQRGRIQSLLRLRFLRRDVPVEDRRQSPLQLRAGRSNGSQTASSITSLRERFTTAADQDFTKMRSGCSGKEITITSPDNESNSTFNQPSERETCTDESDIQRSHTVTTINTQSDTESSAVSNLQAEQSSSHPETATHTINVETSSTSNDQEPEQPINTEPQLQVSEEIPSLEGVWQESRYEELVHLEAQDRIEDTNASYNGWEEEEYEEYEEGSSQQFYESSLDWITDIARPRSYWEDKRQAWYQEVFKTKSQDEEIRQLLERGSVSAVLASDFRDRMDQLVMCNVQRVTHSTTIEEEIEEDRSMRAFLERNMPSFNHYSQEEQQDQEHVLERTEDVRQEEEEYREEDDMEENEDEQDEREVSLSRHQYQDVGDYYDQTPLSSQLQWDHHYEDHDVSDDSDHAASNSLQQPSLVTSDDHDIQEGSSIKNSSIEMELIYDLRGHMEQLYREMSEIRKSITSCMDMQMKLQHSIREEVSAAINHTDRVERKDSDRRKPKKGSCCICYEKKVDSLLYRCGHMCTCFNCANELQWSSGKCPICRAQIVDVVRAYPDI